MGINWPEMDPVIIEMYHQGKSNRETANRLKISPDSVRRRKEILGLRSLTEIRREEEDVKFRPLYLKGMTDREISKKTGYQDYLVAKWRHRFGLEPNKKKAQEKNHLTINLTGGVSYKEILPPKDHAEMERFLRALLTTHRRARQMGRYIDISLFMEIYRRAG